MKKSGTTALVAALRGNKITIANSGDSRGMLLRNNKASGVYEPVLTTQDHKPVGSELERIAKYGARAEWAKAYYIVAPGTTQKICAVSRTLGDIEIKERRLGPDGYKILIPTPEIYFETIEPGDVLALATDGYWDAYDHLKKLNPRHELMLQAEITQADSALAKAQIMVARVEKTEDGGEATDNVTAVVVQFLPVEEKQ